ncbi:MAG TPA: hypothetical protein PKE04_18460, partial [Clostridia bacterium]|nr:hypothetical protein [Clostridia bacterium]
ARQNPVYREILLSPMRLSAQTLPRYVKALDAFGADFIQGYPSAVAHFARLLRASGMRLKKTPHAVFAISEGVYPDQREAVRSAWGCGMHATYGNSERSVFAQQLPNALYAFNMHYGHVELWGEDGGPQRIVSTGFLNRKIPFLRYDSGDFAVCRQGGYEILGHRSRNVLLGRGMEEFSMATMTFTGNALKKAVAVQFVQDTPGVVRMDVLASGRLTPADRAQLCR